MSDPSALKSRAGFDKLAAVKNGRVVILDDNLVSRPGPRVVEGLKQIAEGLHPEAFAGSSARMSRARAQMRPAAVLALLTVGAAGRRSWRAWRSVRSRFRRPR